MCISISGTIDVGHLIGVLLGAGIGYISARSVGDRKAKSDAIAKFRAAFAPTLAKLRFTTKDNLADLRLFLKTEHLKHAAAIEEFRPFIRKCGSFSRAETRYKQHLEKFSFATACEPIGSEMPIWCIKIAHGGGESSFIAETVSVIETLVQCADHDG